MLFGNLSLRHQNVIKHLEKSGPCAGRNRERRARRFALELLETRCLLSTVSEYPAALLPGNKQPVPLEVASLNGKLWFTDQNGAIGMADPSNPAANQVYASSALSGKLPQQIVAGPDGKLYFTQLAPGAIDRLDPSSPNTVQNLTQGLTSGARPFGLAVGANNKIWFTDTANNALGYVDTSTGNITELPSVPGTMVGFVNLSSQIVAGADGKLYFAEAQFNANGTINKSAIGIFDPSNSSYSEVALPAGEQPFSLTLGSDNNVWIAETQPLANGSGFQNPKIGELDISGATPTYHDYAVPTPSGGSTPQPYRIASGRDGQLWFSDTANGAIGAFNASTHTFSPFLTITQNNSSNAKPQPGGLATGADGNIWFADSSGAIGSVPLTTQLVVTTQPSGVTAGRPFGFKVAVRFTGSGAVDQSFNGTVTVSIGNDPAGGLLGGGPFQVKAKNGVATFTGLTLDKVGTHYTLNVSANSVFGSSTGFFEVTAPPITAKQFLVWSQPPATVLPGQPFSIIVYTANSSGQYDPSYTGPATLSMIVNPGGSTLGGTQTVMVTNGIAVFSGLTLNNPASGYVMEAWGGGLTPVTTTPMQVVAPSPVVVISTPVITQRTNGRGRPLGRPVLTGFSFTFSAPMNLAAAGNAGNYQLVQYVQKRQGRSRVLVPQPVGFATNYNPATNSVMITFVGRAPTFAQGGQIVLNGAGIVSTLNAPLAGKLAFTIARNGRGLS
jgi:streptogramin lyase